MLFLIFFSASSYAGNFVSLPHKLKFSPVAAIDLTIANPTCLNTSRSDLEAQKKPRKKKRMQKISKEYVCPVCGKRLAYQYTLDRHRNTCCGKVRNPNGKWKCLFCPKRYDSRGSLTRHNKYECPRVKPQFYCIFCYNPEKSPKNFTQKTSLVRHLKQQHPEQNIGDAIRFLILSRKTNHNAASG